MCLENHLLDYAAGLRVLSRRSKQRYREAVRTGNWAGAASEAARRHLQLRISAELLDLVDRSRSELRGTPSSLATLPSPLAPSSGVSP